MRHAFALVATVSFVTAVVSASPVFAQDTNSARCGETHGTAAGDVTYCFTGEDVAGGVVGPYGQQTHVLRPMHARSLLRIRAHFVPEMLKSVERL